MASQSSIRSRRRNAGQWHALVSLKREIQATDPNSRRKYLREFNEAYQNYQSVLSASEAVAQLAASDIVLIGDYHALPNSQRHAAWVVEQLAASRPVVLALETVFARDQHILDDWLTGEIEDGEFRERIRYDLDWGYPWEPFLEMLQRARGRAAHVYGLDCMPRDDLRKIATRDRHAALKIAELRERHPGAVVVVLFGESHLAPNHLPQLVRELAPEARTTTVLQNQDALYWKATGERRERVEAARVAADVLCVFNATPLEKYESYRLCIEHWRQERAAAPDLAPTVYNLVEALARFLNVERYAAQNHRQPRYLVDMMPEVHSRSSDELLDRLLVRKRASEEERKQIAARIEATGSCYSPRLNALFVREFEIAGVAEEAARFVHTACSGGALSDAEVEPDEQAAAERIFYTRVLENTLAYFGSCVLYPSRPAVRESELYALYAQPREAVEEQSIYGYREYMQLIDFLVLHRDYESHARHYLQLPELLAEGVRFAGEKFGFATQKLGYMLGSDLYDAYVEGRISKRFLRSLFFRKLAQPGVARQSYFVTARRVHGPRRRLVS